VLGADARTTLLLLMGVAALVLVIACANVANLTLMRGVRREHEMVVRAALGAGTSRLRKLLLAENLVLAFGGATLGLVVAFAGVGTLSAVIARFCPRADEIQVDWMVLAFTALLAVVVAFLLSFAPRVGAEHSLGAGLSAGGTQTSGCGRRRRLQQGLVVAQVAVSVVLLSGAGLLVRSMQQLAAVDPGLDPENVLTMEVPLDFTAVTDFARAGRRYEEMGRVLATLPGVEVVGVGSTIPLRESEILLEMKAEGVRSVRVSPIRRPSIVRRILGTFARLGFRCWAGRVFRGSDVRGVGKVVILNKTLGDRLFPGIDPIGRRVAWTGDVLRFIGVSENDWRTVVGVVGDTKDGGLDAAPTPSTFLPFAQSDFPPGGLVIRSAVDPAGLSTAARAIVHSIAPRSAGGECAVADRGARRERGAAAAQCAAGGLVRSARARDRVDRHRGGAGFLCECAHERDRHPHGTWRSAVARDRHDPQRRRLARRTRPRRWRGRITRVVAEHRGPALWRDGTRSLHAARRRPAP
jgi:putative ABC transport system permease protein